MHRHIRERKENTQLCKLKHPNFAVPKNTDVIHDWQALMVTWLFVPFFKDFLVIGFSSLSRQKE